MRIPEKLKERAADWWGIARLDFWLASRNILRQRRRSMVGMIAIATGVIAMVISAGFFEWNFHGMREATIRSRLGHIQVMREGFLQSGVSDPFKYLMPESKEDRSLFEAFGEVDAVAPRLMLSGLISVGESTLAFSGEGVDPGPEEKLNGYRKMLAGRDLASIDAMEVILGQGLAETLGLEVGQTVVLLCKTSAGGVNAIEVKVVGIFSTIMKAYDDYALRLPLRVAQKLVRSDGIHTWLVLLHDTDKTDRVRDKMADKISGRGLEFVAWHETAVADFYKKTVILFSRQVLVVKVMIGIIIVLGIANTMMANVRERISEIGTCMALGDTRRTVLRRLLAEGVVLGAFGGLVGIVAGIVLAQIISAIGIPMPPPPGTASGHIAGIRVTFWIVLDAFLLAVVTAFFAGLFPAWKASRLEIVDALRHAR